MTPMFVHGGAGRPTPDHELLLRAAVLLGAPALDAWRAWRARVDFEAALDRASFRLLPQLYRNLCQHGVDDPVLAKLKGVYRYAWSRNQLLWHGLADVLGALHDAGIATMVLKGVALATLHYRDPGARPMDDVDVLVPWRDAPAAMRILERRGWMPCLGGSPAAHVPYRHALGFRDGSGRELDLHWNVLLECCTPAADAEWWRAAVALDVAGTSTRALCPADQLLHVCVHGASWSPLPPIRWIADAMMVLRSAGEALDWDRFLDESARRRLVVTSERALRYLATRFGAKVPPAVLARLRRLPHSPLERLEYRVKSRPRAARVLGDLPVLACHFLRLTAGGSPGRRFTTLGGLLCYRWELERPSQVPFQALTKAARRLAGAARGRAVDAALHAPPLRPLR